jgi:hypothetical protein
MGVKLPAGFVIDMKLPAGFALMAHRHAPRYPEVGGNRVTQSLSATALKGLNSHFALTWDRYGIGLGSTFQLADGYAVPATRESKFQGQKPRLYYCLLSNSTSKGLR